MPAVRTKHHASSAPQLELGHTDGGPHLTNGYDQPTANGQNGYANDGYTHGTPDPMMNSRYYVNGTANVPKPATAQNF